MAALTGDQVAAILQNSTFKDRIKATVLLKAEYWKEQPTATRASVNRQMQKRKRFAKTILNTSAAESLKDQIGLYWISYYQTATPVLDGNGIPTYAEIFANFDPTYDNFAGYLIGDENETEIDW